MHSEKAKAEHRKHLSTGGRTSHSCEVCLAKGGEVKGVHPAPKGSGTSSAGMATRAADMSKYSGSGVNPANKGAHEEFARTKHKQVLGELRDDKTDRRNLAKGGEVESDDETLAHGCAKEAIDAFHSKDHKKFLSSLKALMPYLKD